MTPGVVPWELGVAHFDFDPYDVRKVENRPSLRCFLITRYWRCFPWEPNPEGDACRADGRPSLIPKWEKGGWWVGIGMKGSFPLWNVIRPTLPLWCPTPPFGSCTCCWHAHHVFSFFGVVSHFRFGACLFTLLLFLLLINKVYEISKGWLIKTLIIIEFTWLY